MPLQLFQKWTIALLALAVLLSGFAPPASAAYPNKKIVVTDVLDDDLRAIVRLMIDPRTKDTVAGFVVTSGNSSLKTWVLRQTLAILGRPDIPVIQGTSTNLGSNNVTAFAGNFELEGKHILSDADRALLAQDKSSGQAGKQVMELMKKQPGQVDFLFLTAPTDVVAAYHQDPALFKGKAGDAISMGFYKEVEKNGIKRLVAPYNSMVDPFSVRNFWEMLSEGVFHRHIHVPSDTVQLRSGLPGGYFPGGEEGAKMKRELTELMRLNSGLSNILTAAKEYGHNWRDFATRTIGVGLQDYDRWVPSSFANPDEAAGFYLADTVPTALSNLTEAELDQLDTQVRKVAVPKVTDPNLPFEFRLSAGGPAASVTDLNSFDGPGELKSYFGNLRTWVKENMGKPYARVSPAVAGGKKALIPGFEVDGKKHALVATFKNSPDDWMALMKTVSTLEGREALKHGGVITEGFETAKMAQAVRAVLADMGIRDIPVVEGHRYLPGEIDAIPNFAGERVLYAEKQGFAAFEDLIAKHSEAVQGNPLLTPFDLMQRSQAWATANDGRIDQIVLGEGVDAYDAILARKEDFAGKLGSTMQMGGGRADASGKFTLTRNWVRESSPGLKRLNEISKLSQGKVFVFSSDQFGGSIVAKGEAPGAAKVSGVFSDAVYQSPAMNAIEAHWENWNRVFSQLGDLSKGLKFDPNRPMNTLTTSPLSLHIQDAWQNGWGEKMPTWWKALVIDPAKVAETSAFPDPKNGVNWLLNKNNSVESLAEEFSGTLKGVTAATYPHGAFQAEGKPHSLVITFKNSPDDWFALLHAASTPEGKQALRRGGVIAEGFETQKMAKVVQSVLAELGLRDVPVAVGHSYQPGEVDAIPNFAGERILYKEQRGFAAFEDLLKKHERDLPATVAPEKLMERTRRWAKQSGGKIDQIVLGEGTDSLKAITGNQAAYENLIGNTYVMGGGRSDPTGKFSFTRNWAREKADGLARMKELSRMSGGNVYVFSSDQFGGSLIARGEVDPQQAFTGNAVKIQKSLAEAADKSEAVKAISKHWENWSQVFSQLGDILKGGAFNPAKEIPVLSISPLALHIEDAWQRNLGKSPPPWWRTVILDPTEIAATGKFPDVTNGVNWIVNKEPSVEGLAQRFSYSLGNIQTGQAAQGVHDAVREHGIFTKEAEEAKRKLAASTPGAKSASECRVYFTKLGNDLPPGK